MVRFINTLKSNLIREMIQINDFDRLEFAKKLKEEVKKCDLNQIKFELTNATAKNVEIIYYYLIQKQIKSIIFIKTKELDLFCFHKFKDYIQKHFIPNSLIIKTTLEGFLNEELFNLLNIRNYLNYCSNQKIEPKWNKELLEKEHEKITKNKHLEKYSKYNYLVSCLEKIPFSKFNFPTEKNKDRFVFYFNVYDEKSKNKALEILNELKVNSEIIELISSNKIGIEVYLYAIGFTYINEEEVRVSLYSQFCETMMLNINFIKNFLYEKHKLVIDSNFRNLWYYAIDYYKDRKEIKLYDEPYIFRNSLENLNLFNILKNKPCVRTLKYCEGLIVDEKFEFHLAKNFSSSEKLKLIEEGYSNSNSKILAIYLKDSKIRNFVNYDL